MKICVAQAEAVKGDIRQNLENHKKLIDLAVDNKAEMIIFPELSITGYEPELAKELANDKDDSRLNDLQEISDTHEIIIGVGMPTKFKGDFRITMIIFQPHQPRESYSKQHVHADEYPFFVNGDKQVFLSSNNNKIAIGICYETSVPKHSEYAFNHGANVYIASSLESRKAIGRALENLSGVARKYNMTVLLANYVGQSGGYDCAGLTSIWNNKGILLGQLNDTDPGILMIDTNTQEITKLYHIPKTSKINQV
jgi:predicted amidohydrolase